MQQYLNQRVYRVMLYYPIQSRQYSLLYKLAIYIIELQTNSLWLQDETLRSSIRNYIIQFQMNINQPPPPQFAPLQPRQNEQKQQQADPLNEINPITLLKKPQQYKQAFFSMTCISNDCFKSKNYERAALALTKCVDMLDLGKNILKDINKFWKIVVYANLACCYHYTRKLSKCNKFCEKIKEELQKIINECALEKEAFLKLSRILIKLKFQHCAILSQLEQHEKAFQLCKSTLPMLKQSIQMLLSYIQESSSSNLMEKKSSETVQFSRQVYRFGQGLLNDLLKCLNQPMKERQRNAFYYWQKNPQQNEQQVKKKFVLNGENNTCKRSILGVSKSTHWIDQFNIGTIMHFSQMNINDFENTIPMEEYLFKDRLYQIVIYCSMAHFTMATELRLIQSTQQEKNQSNNSQINSQINLMKKYGYEQKSELFKLSQIYHLRSIDIMARNIKTTVPYITHIIRSYEKHYIKQKKVLEPIAAIIEESALSINQQKDEKLHKEDEPYYETSYNNYVYTNHEQMILDHRHEPQVEPCNQLLLQSQNYRPQINSKAQLQQNLQKKQANSPNSLQSERQVKKLMTVRSADNLKKIIQSPTDQPNNSDQYLKSQRPNKSSSKVKKSGIREKSNSKAPLIKPIAGPFTKDLKRDVKGQTKRIDYQRNNDYKLKTDRIMDKNKDRQRKTNKKEKLLDLQGDKYGQKQIKIKTQSCTHIKVFYKKKK